MYKFNGTILCEFSMWQMEVIVTYLLINFPCPYWYWWNTDNILQNRWNLKTLFLVKEARNKRYDILYKSFLWTIHEMYVHRYRKQIGSYQGLWGGGMYAWWMQMGIKDFFWGDENVLEISGDGTQHFEMSLKPLQLYTLKWHMKYQSRQIHRDRTQIASCEELGGWEKEGMVCDCLMSFLLGW